MLHACAVVFYIDGPQQIVEKKLRVILSEVGDSWLRASDGEGWEVKSVTRLPSLEEYNRVMEERERNDRS